MIMVYSELEVPGVPGGQFIPQIFPADVHDVANGPYTLYNTST